MASVAQIFGFDGYPVPGDARIDGSGERHAASRGVGDEQLGGMAGELPALRAAMLDDGLNALGIEFGKSGFEVGKVAHSRLGRVFLVFFLSRYLLVRRINLSARYALA